ncbi:DegT/DnrJ/EryC1/StrS family aminotransferase [Patescibacteria group bacterium]|nr:DegT/DnrJ/EryC1/StrS family aminotransferase [Patescibacteria group bacterium]
MITSTKSDLPLLQKYIKYLERIWETRWMTNDGEFVQSFENKLREYLGVKDLVAVSNGTSALQIALKVLNIRGEIITTPFTFAATTNVILWEGLTPVFSDIDPETFNINPDDVERKITDDTSAILAVHVYGNPCDVEKLQDIADKHNLELIHDAAHAFSVEYNDQPIVKYGDLSILSFHATKVFHTIEGGAIISNRDGLLDKLKLLRNHGIKSEEEVIIPGINAKMNEFQAVMGLCNLEDIDEKIELRRKIHEYYKEKLKDLPVKFQRLTASKCNYSYMPVCFKDMEHRDAIYFELLKNGIRSRKYFYPLTVNYDYFKKKGVDLVEKYGLKNAFDISNRVLCLPLYPDLEIQEVDRVISIIEKIIKT